MNHVTIYTIGHSTHTLERFLELVAEHRIEALADVRSSPFSGRLPHFNRDHLCASALARNVEYVYLGEQLGGRARDEAAYDGDGRVNYSRVANTPDFREGISRLLKGAAMMRVALVCAEKDPIECHRGLLIGRHLKQRGVNVEHILPGGGLEPHREAEQRLQSRFGFDSADLFRTEDELLEEAYRRQEVRVAYVRRGTPLQKTVHQ